MPYSHVTRTAFGTEAIQYARGNGTGHNGVEVRNQYVAGVNMFPDGVVPFERQMQLFWDKADPRHKIQINRFIVSFSRNELDPTKPEDCLTALDIGCEIAKLNAPDSQSAVFVQNDGESGLLHLHILTNDVKMSDYKGLDSKAYFHASFRSLVDKICTKHFKLDIPGMAPERVNPHVRGQRIKNEQIIATNNEEIMRAAAEGRPVDQTMIKKEKYIWQDDLRERIKFAARGATDEASFAQRLRVHGVELVPHVAKDGTVSYLHPATKKQPAHYTYELVDVCKFDGKIPANLKSKSFKLGSNYQPEGIAQMFVKQDQAEPENKPARPVIIPTEVMAAAQKSTQASAKSPEETRRERDMAELKRIQRRAREFVAPILYFVMPDANEEAVFGGFLEWRKRRRTAKDSAIKPIWRKNEEGRGVIIRDELEKQYNEYLALVTRNAAEQQRIRIRKQQAAIRADLLQMGSTKQADRDDDRQYT